MKKNEKGFGAVEILLLIVVIVVIGFVGWKTLSNKNQKTKNSPTTSQSSQNNTTTEQNSETEEQTPAGTTVKTTDGHAEFTLPMSWKVVQRHNGEDGQQYCGFAVPDEELHGTCLLDITYQPSSLNTGGQTFWYTKIFETTKSPAKWYADAVASECINAQQKTLNGYQELICDNGDFVVSNGQYLAQFVVRTDKSETEPYQADFNTIISSIKFN